MKIKNIAKFAYFVCWSLFLAITLTIVGCGGTPTQGEDPALAPEPKTAESAKSKGDDTTTTATEVTDKKEEEIGLDETSSATSDALLLTPVIALSSSKKGVPKRVEEQPDGVIDFCKVKPYTKSKRQVKNGIKAAWEDTQAGKYGVGFRNKAEYKKWNSTQKDFFLYMFDACKSLAVCEINNKKNKKKDACKVQQAKFDAWQSSAKLFAKKIKKLKTQQPSALCSLQPQNGDVSLCFNQRAAQIDNACDGEVCKELSQCWTSVAMKDDVIRQAESSCRFFGQKSSKCRGHIEAIKHRKEQFTKCNKMQNDINLAFEP